MSSGITRCTTCYTLYVPANPSQNCAPISADASYMCGWVDLLLVWQAHAHEPQWRRDASYISLAGLGIKTMEQGAWVDSAWLNHAAITFCRPIQLHGRCHAPVDLPLPNFFYPPKLAADPQTTADDKVSNAISSVCFSVCWCFMFD